MMEESPLDRAARRVEEGRARIASHEAEVTELELHPQGQQGRLADGRFFLNKAHALQRQADSCLSYEAALDYHGKLG